MVGAVTYWIPVRRVAVLPNSSVTATAAAPSGRAGAVKVICVEFWSVAPATGFPARVMPKPGRNRDPVTVMVEPPARGW